MDPRSEVISNLVSGVCRECMVLFAKGDLAKPDGTKNDLSSGIYSHHIFFTDIGNARGVMPPVVVKCTNGGGFMGYGGFDFSKMMSKQPKGGSDHSAMAGMYPLSEVKSLNLIAILGMSSGSAPDKSSGSSFGSFTDLGKFLGLLFPIQLVEKQVLI
jgi:hypothetical protein